MSWLLRATALVCCILALPWLVVSASQIASDPQSRGDSPTFNADVAPILRAKCLTCHRQDGDAPFPLETFEQVRRRGSMIRQLTASGYMPPWKPSAESLAFIGDRRLSANEKSVIAAMGGGRACRKETTIQVLRPSRQTQRLGLGACRTLPSRFLNTSCPRERADVFRNFVVAVPFTGTRYVRGFQFRPRSPAVHHANIRVDSNVGVRATRSRRPGTGL